MDPTLARRTHLLNERLMAELAGARAEVLRLRAENDALRYEGSRQGVSAEWLTPTQAALRADVALSTIYQWMRERKIKALRNLDDKWMVDQTSLVAFVKAYQERRPRGQGLGRRGSDRSTPTDTGTRLTVRTECV